MPTAQHADLDEQIKNINAQLRAGGADILAAIEEAWGAALRADYRPGMAQLRWLHACYHFMRANYADALRLAEESRQLFRTVDRPIELARCLNTIASCHLSLGDPARALQFFLESRELTTRRREANPTLADSLLSSLLNNIALVYDSLGDVEKALELFRENLERKREAGDRAGMLFALNNIGLLYFQLGDYDNAHRYHHQALELAEQTQHRGAIADTLNNLANCLKDGTEKYEEALLNYQQALAIYQEVGDQRGVAAATINIGDVMALLGRNAEAAAQWERGLAMTTDPHLADYHVAALMSLAGYQRDECGAHETAIELLQTALAHPAVDRDQTRRADIHRELAQAYRLAENFQEAFHHLSEHHTLKDKAANERSTLRIRAMMLQFDVEHAQKEAEIAYLRNVELAQANAELQQANHRLVALNHEKNEFLGITAHDLKNPIAAIRGFAGLLRDRKMANDPSLVTELATDILQTADRMFETITNLLDINRLEEGSVQIGITAVDVAATIDRVTRPYLEHAAQKGQTLRVEPHEGAVRVMADPNLLAQALDNLVSNAVKFSPRGKQITVRVVVLGGKTRIEVQDQGPGLTAKDRERLFGKFARLSARPTGGEHSTGLGLFIVQRLMKLMGGSVWCQSEPGNGALFVLEFPAAAAAHDFNFTDRQGPLTLLG
ncbi:MAG: tetratricopeptide repeat-containing sensor histidine kinase [Chlorobi bacterium]|nr:MAG: Two-component system-sensor histidine kinase [Chlorobi bacterium OLB7]MBK8911380.1 tetratricopeptide repeat-containing sensor histidine kinase [Chlorobiota bacterium]